jgi:cobalt-zinc-cadmium efflux system membrane fusion protein
MRFSVGQVVRVVCVVTLAIALLVGLAVSTGAVPPPWKQAEKPAPSPAGSPSTVELVPGVPHTLQVPDEVRRNLGILKRDTELIAEVGPPAHGRPLVMSGSTMLDPSRIMRIRARFTPSPSSAEVVEIARVPEHPSGRTLFREIRSGDHVSKGEVLAVFSSVDVGTKKNDLADALYQLALDEEILKRAEASSSAVPEVFLLNARRNVEVDRNAVNRAVNTLQTWGIPEEDIQAVRDEAENIKRRQGKRDKEKQASWARVEMRAPDDGVIVERNVSLHEIIADNTTNLFQIAKVDQLTVIAYVPEDDLPKLQALPSPDRHWTVQTVGSPQVDGPIDDIGYIIDPNQHTAVVKGHIDNPRERLRAGQFVSATVQLSRPPDVVEVPIEAIVDDGQQSIVFVETNKAKRYYTMRRVELVQRFEKTAYVRSKPFTKPEERTRDEMEMELLPRQPLVPGDRVLLTGAGELKIALLDRESQAKTEAKETKDD